MTDHYYDAARQVARTWDAIAATCESIPVIAPDGSVYLVKHYSANHDPGDEDDAIQAAFAAAARRLTARR